MSFLPSFDQSTVNTLLEVKVAPKLFSQFPISSPLIQFLLRSTYGSVIEELYNTNGDENMTKAIRARMGKINDKKNREAGHSGESGYGIRIKVAPSTGDVSTGYGVVALQQIDDPTKMQKGVTPAAIIYAPMLITDSDLMMGGIQSETPLNMQKLHAFTIAMEKYKDAKWKTIEAIRDMLYGVDQYSLSTNATIEGNSNPLAKVANAGVLSLAAPFYNSSISTLNSSYLRINRSPLNAPYDKFNGTVVSSAITLDNLVDPSSAYYFPKLMRYYHQRIINRGGKREDILWIANPNIDLAFAANLIAGSWSDKGNGSSVNPSGRGFSVRHNDIMEGFGNMGATMDNVPIMQDEFCTNFYGNTSGNLVGYALDLGSWEMRIDPDFFLSPKPLVNTGNDTGYRGYTATKLQLLCSEPRRNVLFTNFGTN